MSRSFFGLLSLLLVAMIAACGGGDSAIDSPLDGGTVGVEDGDGAANGGGGGQDAGTVEDSGPTDDDAGDGGDGSDSGGGSDSGADAASPPVLVSSIPADQAADVDVTGSIVLEFSEPMNTASVTVTTSPSITLGAVAWDATGTQAVFPIAAPLAFETKYQVTVAGRDLQGESLAGASFSFTTRADGSDSTPPTITSSTPSNGASSVATTTTLAIVFSEPMDIGTVAVVTSPSVALGTPTWASGNTQVSFPAPAEPWAAATSYVVTVSGSDLAGNPLAGNKTISFTTAAPPDTTPPQVQSTAPASGAADVATTTSVSVTFSEPMATGTVSASTFTVKKTGGTPLAGTFTWDATHTLVTFKPTAPLEHSTTYEVSLTTGIRDAANNALAAPYSFSFATAAAPDTTPPTVVSSDPANGAIGVPLQPTIVVTFSEPMDKASVQTAFAITSPAGVSTGAPSWSADGKTMAVPLTTTLGHGATVTWRVDAGAKDLAGNGLVAAVTRTFRVIRLVRRHLSPTLDGYVVENQNAYVNTTSIDVGDNSSNRAYRGFIGFDLGSLPSSLIRITNATFTVKRASGGEASVYASLGPLYLESVDFGTSLALADFDVPTLQHTKCTKHGTCVTEDLRVTLASQPTTTMSVNQLDKGTDDWNKRASRGNRCQFRIRFSKKTDNGGDFDVLYLYAEENSSSQNRPQLTVEYEIP